MELKALFLNCTLKKSPEESNTEAMIKHTAEVFHELDVKTEVIRVVDHDVRFGNTSDEGDGDEWPKIYDKIKAADIFIIATPLWRGDRGSVAKIVAERLDGAMSEGNDQNGQYPTYNKIGGCLIDGNEDGAKKAISSICFDLSEHGFTVPVNAFAYWVGEAGPGPSYVEAEGYKHTFTNNMIQIMTHNMVHLAKLLKNNPYPANLNILEEKAESMNSIEA